MVLTDEWLNGAREDLNAELEYVYDEFGTQSAEEAYIRKRISTTFVISHTSANASAI
jgi:hypothetical protein